MKSFQVTWDQDPALRRMTASVQSGQTTTTTAVATGTRDRLSFATSAPSARSTASPYPRTSARFTYHMVPRSPTANTTMRTTHEPGVSREGGIGIQEVP